MDDIRVGMYITILRGKQEQRVVPGPQGPKTLYREKDMYNGKVLEVVALDMPYAVVKVHSTTRVVRTTIDMRQIEMMALTPQYILSLFPDLEINVDSFWDRIEDATLEADDATIRAIFEDL